jgi:hypothetical protein
MTDAPRGPADSRGGPQHEKTLGHASVNPGERCPEEKARDAEGRAALKKTSALLDADRDANEVADPIR